MILEDDAKHVLKTLSTYFSNPATQTELQLYRFFRAGSMVTLAFIHVVFMSTFSFKKLNSIIHAVAIIYLVYSTLTESAIKTDATFAGITIMICRLYVLS